MSAERLILFASFAAMFTAGFVHWIDLPSGAGWAMFGGLNLINVILSGRW